jgi:hypothetical protein
VFIVFYSRIEPAVAFWLRLAGRNQKEIEYWNTTSGVLPVTTGVVVATVLFQSKYA